MIDAVDNEAHMLHYSISDRFTSILGKPLREWAEADWLLGQEGFDKAALHVATMGQWRAQYFRHTSQPTPEPARRREAADLFGCLMVGFECLMPCTSEGEPLFQIVARGIKDDELWGQTQIMLAADSMTLGEQLSWYCDTHVEDAIVLNAILTDAALLCATMATRAANTRRAFEGQER